MLNSFLLMIEQDESHSLIVAATNHPELLDRALIRRFDEIVEYGLPDEAGVRDIVKRRLGGRASRTLKWDRIGQAAHGLSHGEVSRAVEEALREAILGNRKTVDQPSLITALDARRAMREAMADLFNE